MLSGGSRKAAGEKKAPGERSVGFSGVEGDEAAAGVKETRRGSGSRMAIHRIFF